MTNPKVSLIPECPVCGHLGPFDAVGTFNCSRAALANDRVVKALDRWSFLHPGYSTAPCYSIELGWFMTNLSNPPKYFQSADDARSALADLMEIGEL